MKPFTTSSFNERDFWNQLQKLGITIFSGEATRVEARLYLKAPRSETGQSLQLQATLTGPYCEYAKTLPVTIRSRDLGPGPTVLSSLIIPDPCCWSAELPFFYHLKIEVTLPTKETVLLEHCFGVRRFGFRESSCYLEGQRVVIRGTTWSEKQVSENQGNGNQQPENWRVQTQVTENGVAVTESAMPAPENKFLRECFPDCRDFPVTLVVENPSFETLQAATYHGALLIVRIRTVDWSPSELLDYLYLLAGYPAVGLIVLPPIQAELSEFIEKNRPRDVQFARSKLCSKTHCLPGWAEALFYEIGQGKEALVEAKKYLALLNIPVVAYRPFVEEKNISFQQVRAACDSLQRDLAPELNLAGYLV